MIVTTTSIEATRRRAGQNAIPGCLAPTARRSCGSAGIGVSTVAGVAGLEKVILAVGARWAGLVCGSQKVAEVQESSELLRRRSSRTTRTTRQIPTEGRKKERIRLYRTTFAVRAWRGRSSRNYKDLIFT